jgi:ATP-dependent Clp protease ATP-binding subunit ClpA
MPDELTERTLRVIRLARDIVHRTAIRQGGELAVLTAILEDNGGVAAAILRQVQLHIRTLYLALEKITTDPTIPARAESEIEQLVAEAAALRAASGAAQVGTELLLVAILWKPDCAAAQVLSAAGITQQTIHAAAGAVAARVPAGPERRYFEDWMRRFFLKSPGP